jgi:hypothetical protein
MKPERRRVLLLAGGCALAALAVFAPAVRLPFVSWDDLTNVVNNPHLRLDGPGLSWILSGASLGHWAPLTWLSLALDRAVWGLDPRGFHLTSVLLHALDAGLFFLLARRLLRPAFPAGDADLAAVFAALVWALHPLRVESVAWVSERRDVLSGALILGCLLAWVRGAEAGEDARGESWRRAAFLLGAAAMAAKVFAVVLPLLLLVLDDRLRGRPRWK